MKSFQDQTFYELLDLPVTATTEQVRVAYQHAQEIYAPDSVALYSLVDPAQADALRERLQEALRTLTEPAQRAAYNRAVGLVEALAETPAANAENEPHEGAPPARRLTPVPPLPPMATEAERATTLESPIVSAAIAMSGEVTGAQTEAAAASDSLADGAAIRTSSREARARVPEVRPDSEVNGELLRQLREARGLTLQALADRTRITRSHLENVEADRYGKLPPTVYLRGILINLSRELKVDAQLVCRSYLALVAAAAGAKR